MLKSRVEIKAIARERLRQNRSTAILILLVYTAISMVYAIISTVLDLTGQHGTSFLLSTVYTLFILVMLVNIEGEFIKLYQGNQASVGAIFTGFKVNFWRKLGGMLWMALWIYLWMLLLIIPGIVKGFAYLMAPFILASCPDVKAREALKLSMRMTAGYKGELFIMYLSFIGWSILSALTLGILGIVFVFPYFFLTCAGYFVELRDHAIANGKISPEELGMPTNDGESNAEQVQSVFEQ